MVDFFFFSVSNYINKQLTYSVFDNAIAKNSAKSLIFVTILVIVKQILKTSEGIFHCIVRHHLQREYANNARKDLFSLGEKQMINFARIMVEDPSVVILDEITSSLSYENENLVKNAITEITKDKICFIIAHRLSTIKSCNKIIYMEDEK